MRALIALAVLAAALPVTAQSVDIRVAADVLHVRVAALGLIEGEVLQRLKDGRAVQVDFELTVHRQREGPPVARAPHRFNVSFDLWEQRFAVTRLGTPARSVSHLRARDAEAWCIDQVTIPLSALGPADRSAVWIRLDFRVKDPALAAEADEPTFTLRRLIDVLSRRPDDHEWGRSMMGGPFRIGK